MRLAATRLLLCRLSIASLGVAAMLAGVGGAAAAGEGRHPGTAGADVHIAADGCAHCPWDPA